MTIRFDSLDDDLNTTSSPLGTVVMPARGGLYRNFTKRVFDLALILLTAPLVVPFLIVLCVIAARDGSSPFFWNDRVGKNGKTFRMLKLRTMVPNAEKMLEQHLASDPDARIEWDTTQKLKNDPRVTRFGRFLRRSSMDELPQLWNVIIGNMSLVGPRPMLPSQRDLYPGLAYYSVAPGMTGLWQVWARNDSEFAKRADFDRTYLERMSFFTDISILARTVRVIVRGTGY